MKKCILSFLLFCFTLVEAQNNVACFLLVGHKNDSLLTVDTTNFNQIRGIQLTCDSVIKGVTGISRNPKTGIYYVMMRFKYETTHHNRFLGTLDPATGQVTIVGNTGDRFGNIVFLPSGKLLSITGIAANTQESLFYIDINDGHSTFIRSLTGGDGGEAIAYNPNDGKIYHRGGRSIAQRILEKLDTISFASTLIPQTGYQNFEHEVFGLLKIKNKRFIGTTLNLDSSRYDVITVDTSGFYSLRRIVNSNYKGMEYVSCIRQISGTLSFCQGNSTTLTATAGALGYQWYKSGVLLPGQIAQTLTVVAGGKYNCMISDLCGSDSLVASVTVQQNSKPFVILTVSGASNFCDGGSALLSGSAGGTSNWFLNGGLIPGANTNTFTATTSGLYNMIKTNSNGCADSAAVGKTITVYPLPTASISSQQNVTCYGGSNGSAVASASGGNSPYAYSWSSGSTSSNATQLIAASYAVTVLDANLCSANAVTVITQPTEITTLFSITPVLCHGVHSGTIMASASGGHGPYTYSWSTGGTSFFENNLAAGNYILTVTDDSLCSIVSPPVVITQPPAIMLVLSSTDISCNGGSNGTASVVATGGTGTLTYSWSNGASSASISNLSSNSYSVFVTDSNMCVRADSNTVVVNEPAVLLANLNAVDVSCNGFNDGSIISLPSGGTGPYLYSWSNGSTGSLINNLPAGVYSLSVTDSNLCSTFSTATVNQPSAITVNATITNVQAVNDGSITINVSGGIASYTFSWSNGETTQDINSLGIGVYTLVLTDANGCIYQNSYPIIIDGIPKNNDNDLIQLFPNPNTGAFQIKSAKKMKLLLVDSMNQLVAEFEMEKNGTELVSEKLKAGIYFLRSVGGNANLNYKIVVTK